MGPGLVLRFLGGTGCLFLPLSDITSMESQFEFKVSNIIPQRQGGIPDYNVHVAHLEASKGFVPGIEGKQFKVAVGVDATKFSGSLPDFFHFICQLMKSLDTSPDALERRNSTSSGSLPIDCVWPLRRLSDEAAFMFCFYDHQHPVKIDNHWFPSSKSNSVTLRFKYFDQDIDRFMKSLPDYLPEHGHGYFRIHLKSSHCYVPGLAAGKKDFSIEIPENPEDTVNSKLGSLAEFLNFLRALKAAAIATDPKDTPEQLKKKMNYYAEQSLPAYYPTGSTKLHTPDDRPDDRLQEKHNNAGTEEEWHEDIPEGNGFNQALPPIPVVYPDMNEEQKNYLIQWYGIRQDTPLHVVQVMFHYQFYRILEKFHIHPQFAIRMMYWGSKTFTECCHWLEKQLFPVADCEISVYKLPDSVIFAVRSLGDNLNKVYALFEDEYGKLPGTVCIFCKLREVYHTALFCARYPTLASKQAMLRANSLCIGCARKCMRKAYEHDAISGINCDVCSSRCHSNFLCDSEYVAAKIAMVTHKIAIMTFVTQHWNENEFLLLKNYIRHLVSESRILNDIYYFRKKIPIASLI